MLKRMVLSLASGNTVNDIGSVRCPMVIVTSEVSSLDVFILPSDKIISAVHSANCVPFYISDLYNCVPAVLVLETVSM